MRKKIDDCEIRKDIIRVKLLLNKIPSQKDYRKYGEFSICSVLLRKTWNEWMMELFNETNVGSMCNNTNKISEDELINNLIEISKKINRPVEQKDLVLGKYSLGPYLRVFKQFSKALLKANLQITKRYDITDEEILLDIYKISKKLNKYPTMDEFNTMSDTVSNGTVVNRFKSWNNAVDLANKKFNLIEFISKEDIKKAIVSWVVKNNNDLSCLKTAVIKEAKEDGKFLYSLDTIVNKFSGLVWKEIIMECGFNYNIVENYIQKGIFTGFDGIKYSSSIEKQIGDYLYNLKNDNILNDYVFKYSLINKIVCDFFVKLKNDNIFVLDIEVNNKEKDLLIKQEYCNNNDYNYFILKCEVGDFKYKIKKYLIVK